MNRSGMPSVSVGSSVRAAREQFDDRGAGATGHGVFFDGHERVMFAGEAQHQFFVEWFDEAHVDDGGVEALADDLGRSAPARRTRGSAGRS